jgi:PAS domain S-box-containing protein
MTPYDNISNQARKLCESEHHYRRLIEASSEGVWVLDPSESILLVNDAMARMLGYAPDEMLGRHPFAFLEADEQQRLRALLDQPKQGIPEPCEIRFRRKEGLPAYTRMSVNPIFDQEGNLSAILSMVTDFTKRRRDELLQVGLNYVLESLATGRSLEDVLAALLLVIEERFPGTIASHTLHERNGRNSRFATAPESTATYADTASRILVGPADDAPKSHQPDFRTWWSQPILSSKKVTIGTFAIHARESTAPTAEEIQVIENAAHLAGLTIERRQAEEAQNELQLSTEKALALLDTLQTHAPVGFAFLDSHFRFARINETLAAMNDLPASDHLGRTVAEIVPNLWPQVQPLFQRALAGEPILDIEISGETPSRPGERRYWLESFYPVRVRGDEITGIGVVVLEITERKRAEAAAHDRELAAHREAVRAMEGVLGVVGHELRTPLAGMRAISEFLLTDVAPPNSETEELLKHLNTETVRMADTINDLLEATRLNSGHAQWKWAAVDLKTVCREAVETIRPLVDAERIQFAVNVSPPDATMQGDADAIRRLVINLLSNARKHTTRGHIAINVSLPHDNGDAMAHIEVSDTGKGIPRKILGRLGEAFALNAGVVGSNSLEGTGLGLAICKGIAAAHGGLLAVASTLGAGTRITARLRADLPHPAVPSPNVQIIHDATPTQLGASA